ncbi:DUF618-domain-containing protein [Corynespora cassiicola Philippines]|uniref:DUF618-domain-containing protein n=1 Tax=Corynespora cassiicola Philippines TaxID=1448308 RepID=A0A2T2N3Y2_CORCC|nr:DUF618-domain-containing protein [Corynespora cassiicola Philippines]
MAFTEDSLRAKLSSLNETQDSISTVGQWILFHRRHAERIAQLWFQRVKEATPNKKLNLIYLANEITQTSKIRKKEEFLRAYEPIIADATAAAYKGSSPDVQNKIRRVVEVWRQRQVFAPPIQTDIERAIDEIDRTRSSRKPALGGSLFSSASVPPELTPVAPLATSLQKADLNAKPAVATANQEFEKATSSNYQIPTPPVHVAGLAALVKKLAVAEGAVAESIKARQALVAGLEKLLETNKTKLAQEEIQVTNLNSRKNAVETRKREIEDGILRGSTPEEMYRISAAPLPGLTPDPASSTTRPNVEELTPPPMESFTPVGSPQHVPDDVFPAPVANSVEPVAAAPATPAHSTVVGPTATTIGPLNPPGVDLLQALTTPHPRSDNLELNGGLTTGGASNKKRKMSRSAAEDEYAAFAGDGDMAGIDDKIGDLI